MKQLFFLFSLMTLSTAIFSQAKIDSAFKSKIEESLKVHDTVTKHDIVVTHDTVNIYSVEKTDTVKVPVQYADKIGGGIRYDEANAKRTMIYSDAIKNDCHCQLKALLLYNKKWKKYKHPNSVKILQ